MYFGWMMAEGNQMYPTLKVLFDWDDDEYKLYTAVINTARMWSAIPMALSPQFFVRFGRRKTLLCVNILGMGACCICVIAAVPAMVVGRFLKGIAIALFQVFGSKIIQETAPQQLISPLGSLVNTGIGLGVVIPSIIGLGYQDVDGLKQEDVNNFWRLNYLLPLTFLSYQLFMLLFVYK
mmetsp:Transcript_45952/g.33706  ORF Transcript_45952/g.33706 Transcript_45952/m.33706 type:complete len:179 (-) Transcript_45952:1049-1585(-)|eukprot:CAMPEP_0202960680 /NCGR_PEP_ID=MMETSP1396-20130829/4836_1 /ASSEMBLY_ACC=CAM_ASM_000872 /TAXON_ID= /ORGANISM="Pseudokeronopsis sp., Strain Brazil" /LENGTH=178 /DNA_ID=CAMNT_0049680057 /DNA_START=128 /DNA_END=664 /DNA_ORIENTATION=-